MDKNKCPKFTFPFRKSFEKGGGSFLKIIMIIQRNLLIDGWSVLYLSEYENESIKKMIGGIIWSHLLVDIKSNGMQLAIHLASYNKIANGMPRIGGNGKNPGLTRFSEFVSQCHQTLVQSFALYIL